MDKCGEGEEIELKNLAHARELSFIGFTHDMFQEVGNQLLGKQVLTQRCPLNALAQHCIPLFWNPL